MVSKRKPAVPSSQEIKISKKLKHRVGPLPVTLLSGFLGSGKTTLLQHILQSNHGLRIAVIVNDIGAVNVDATTIQSTHRIRKTDEKVIALQNGCICCTLRQDLLSELVELSEKHVFDYVIIESSGISEPGQVAESFDSKLTRHMYNMLKEQGELDENEALKKLHKAGEAGMGKFARLDTSVTVIDSFTIYNDFNTADLLSSRRNDVTPEDERTVSDLMVDQIEFADVIILNKTDMVDEAVLAKTKALVRTMNREAKILCSNYGKVDVGELVNTGLFSLDKAQTSSGWMRDLHELMIREVNGKTSITPKPETEEYNVRNFVYKRHRPFHPERLWRLVYDKFILQLEHPDLEEDSAAPTPEITAQKPGLVAVDDGEFDGTMDDIQPNNGDWEDEDTDMEGEVTMSDGSEISSSGETSLTSPTADRPESSVFDKKDTRMDFADPNVEEALATPPKDVVLANKRAHPLFARLFRSKGTYWLATRPDYRGIWSQAGAMLTLVGSTRWDVTLTPEELSQLYHEDTTDPEIMKQVRHDIESGGEWGDRRQEIVFIGEKLEVRGIELALDECLLTDAEWKRWKRGMRSVVKNQTRLRTLMEKLDAAKETLIDGFEDAFPEWEGHFQDEEYGHNEDDEDNGQHLHQH
ncbi:hypothetical protein J7T55_001635 [Diaporthe amygdali]|uniref:uncharacterized protein n=1 Tax=Phomopsis amygdali TaxID=1214568 RepID=UPI0022FDF672|nr:uncharacterized protein J7T55_001635 [Diaporthe amygdali]KAJ0115225.1 hypothetical protein J7T55_001635 [Diaporthe amygdali]